VSKRTVMLRSRGAAVCAVAAGICCASGAASSGPAQLRPRTLAVVPGSVHALTQDGPRLAWIGNQPCPRRVGLHDLRARRSIALEQRGVRTGCRRATEEAPQPEAIALGGSRAVWVVSLSRGNSQHVAGIVTAAATGRRNRIVALHDVAEQGGGPDPRVAGDGSTLVFWSAARRESYVRRIVGRTAKRLFAIGLPPELAAGDVAVPPLHPLPLGLAAAGGRVAVLENVTPSCPCNVNPQWSPDGTRIAWSRAGAVYVMNADGSGKRRVSPAGGAALTVQPWSPDGTRLTYGYRRSDRAQLEVHVVGADGRGRRRVTAGEHPMWSPGAQRLSYVRGGNVWTIESDGSGARRLTSDGRGAHAGAEWSRDGTRLAAVRREGLYVISAGGSGQTRISRLGSVNPHGGPARWSRTGDRIAFSDGDQVVVVNRDGTGRRRLGEGRNPAWSPDGTRLAFDRPTDARVFVVSSLGGAARVVTKRVMLAGPSWSPDRGAIVAGDAGEDSGIVAFQVGRQIRAFDAQTRAARTIVTAAAKPVGHSIDGRRLAWTEYRRGRTLIRAVTLPARLR
jgi:hypothetical protein